MVCSKGRMTTSKRSTPAYPKVQTRRQVLVKREWKGREAIETSDMVLQEEIRRADYLCKEEEDACSDVESTNDPDYLDDEESSSDGDYESDFIDDTDEDHADTKRALSYIRK